jgi:hypothetical protein
MASHEASAFSSISMELCSLKWLDLIDFTLIMTTMFIIIVRRKCMAR